MSFHRTPLAALAFAALTAAVALAPSSLGAQKRPAAADSMAFPRKVYIVVARHETAPELAAHVIQYAPGSTMFERFGAHAAVPGEGAVPGGEASVNEASA